MKSLKEIIFAGPEIKKARATIETLESKEKLTKKEQKRLAVAQQIELARRKTVAKIALVMGFATLGAIYGTTKSCEEEKVTDQTTEVAPQRGLFNKNEKTIEIERALIPEQLPVLIREIGNVEVPENYDPEKANIYLIATSHVQSSNNFPPNMVQEECVRFFHILHALGVRKQFLEGVDSSVELTHDTVNPKLGENPITALPEYKKTGKINRAYIAVEGIYGDDVESVGVENEMEYMHIKRKYLHAINVEFHTIIRQIVSNLADRLKITVDHKRLIDRRYIQSIIEEIDRKTGALSAEEVSELVNEVVLANDAYSQFADTVSERFYYRIQGRNETYAKRINADNENQQQDAAFIVGAQHVKGLKRLIKDANVFILLPGHLEPDAESPFFLDYSKKDYRDKVIAHDLSTFGLAEKPEEDLFN